VLMDMQMPVMGGIEATRGIRQGDSLVRNKQIPVIAMTANAMISDRQACLEAGMNDYISKPVNRHELADIIGKWLDRDGANKDNKDCGEIKDVADIPVFDKVGLRQLMMDDADLVETVISAFLEDTPNQIRDVRGFIEKEDGKNSEIIAHAIKGSAATVRGESMSQVASRMEKAAKTGDLDKANDLLPKLEDEFARLKKAMLD
jgi:HPt (histidine-containing phosphotransfer) domain-containing protein